MCGSHIKKSLTIGMIPGCLFNHLPYKATLSLVLKQYDRANPQHNDSNTNLSGCCICKSSLIFLVELQLIQRFYLRNFETLRPVNFDFFRILFFMKETLLNLAFDADVTKLGK